MANIELLKEYFKSRRLADATKENYLNAVKDFDNVIEKEIGDIDEKDLEAWYDKTNGIRKSGTILTYATKLRILHVYALTKQGLSKKDARVKSDDLFQVIPLSDLKKSSKKENHLRDQLVHPDEFKTLMRGAKHPRIQAMFSMLYDSACRKGELLSLRLRDVDFREEGYVIIRVQGKTGERSIPLVDSIPYLKQWLQTHPDRENLDAPLFAVTIKGRIQPMGERSINHVMSRICRKMGIRHLNPHQLRHTRLTDLAKSGAGEFNLKSYAGWTPNSDMAAKYIHMNGSDHVNPILSLQGFDVENGRKGIPQVISKIRCPNCDNEAGSNSQFCPFCGYVLDEKLRMERTDRERDIDVLRGEVSELKNMVFELLNNPELANEVKKRLQK